MSAAGDALYDRVANAAGVSVGTAMALEAVLRDWPIFDMAKQTKFTPIERFGEVYINTATMARNLVAAVDNDYRLKLNATQAGEVLAEECIAVRDAIVANSNGATSVVFYQCSYDDFKTRFITDKFYQPHTPRQIYYADLEKKVLKYLDTALHNQIKHFRTALRPDSRKSTLMLSHYPVDLLSNHSFGSLALLESHTAAIKSRNRWYTKLHNGAALAQIPFNNFSIQIFGDGVQLRPQDNKIKQEILKLAAERKWSWMTSESSQKEAIKKLSDQFLAQTLLRMF